MALEYLHKNNIVCRDIKPDSILIAENGHIKLSNFGLSTLTVTEDLRSNSFTGADCYLAPEIFNQSSYGKNADWYSLGVVLYDFIVGSI